MKKYLKRLQAVGLLALMVPALLLTGCNDDDNNTQPEQRIAEVVNTNSDFSLLRAAVNRAGIASALNSGTLTVFAPNNAAFQAAGLTEAAINAQAPEAIAAVLQYHVVNGRQTAGSLPTAKNTAVTALSNGTTWPRCCRATDPSRYLHPPTMRSSTRRRSRPLSRLRRPTRLPSRPSSPTTWWPTVPVRRPAPSIPPTALPNAYKSRFLVRFGDRIQFKSAAEVACFWADGKITYLVAGDGRRYIVDSRWKNSNTRWTRTFSTA